MLRWLEEQGFDLANVGFWEVVSKQVHASGYMKSNAQVCAFVEIVVRLLAHEASQHNTGQACFDLRRAEADTSTQVLFLVAR